MTSAIYLHPGDEISGEGSEIQAAEILAGGDLFVAQENEMVRPAFATY
jgi:hypothetical protein